MSELVEQLEALSRSLASQGVPNGIVGVVWNSDAKLLARAAAEIRELRAEVGALKLASVMDGDVVELVTTDNARLREACMECVAHCGECNGTGANILCGDVPCKTCSTARAALKEPDNEPPTGGERFDIERDRMREERNRR